MRMNHACVLLCMRDFMHACIYACVQLCMCAFMHACIYACMHSFMYACSIHIHIHNHTFPSYNNPVLGIMYYSSYAFYVYNGSLGGCLCT